MTSATWEAHLLSILAANKLSDTNEENVKYYERENMKYQSYAIIMSIGFGFKSIWICTQLA